MKKITLLTKSTLLMGMLVAMGTGSASASDDQEITKGYTIKVTHSHTGDAPIIVEEQPALTTAQYSVSRSVVELTFNKAVTTEDLASLSLTKNAQAMPNVSYTIDATDATRVTAAVAGVGNADELAVQFKKSSEIILPVSKVAAAKFVPKLEVTRQFNKKVMGKVERGAKVSAVLTDAHGVKTPQKINVKRTGNWTYEANVAPGSYVLTVVAEKNNEKIAKDVAVHIVK
ncbi:hypothetical protein CH76_09750 [Lysinibacillus sp. BF-4]|uniref:hypothetical protein n=1 Tax=Lysinibacillus sp. BF-4 TaxID=1473546 RepID=UPI0005022482|nr:hypothetical protein [Lysinibacillus sp. BF-4]KFL42905.1 hypothetical protein CH76_09750 [Lysinibacillus sp. BF-4]